MYHVLRVYIYSNKFPLIQNKYSSNFRRKKNGINCCLNESYIFFFGFSSTSCSTSSCTTSCNTPYVIFETNSLPYVQRTIVSERDSSSTSACIDDSGGGGEIPIDNNNIGDDDADNNGGSDHILKRNSASVLQRHSFENVENDNDNDDDDEDETSQGIYAVFYHFLLFIFFLQ